MSRLGAGQLSFFNFSTDTEKPKVGYTARVGRESDKRRSRSQVRGGVRGWEAGQLNFKFFNINEKQKHNLTFDKKLKTYLALARKVVNEKLRGDFIVDDVVQEFVLYLYEKKVFKKEFLTERYLTYHFLNFCNRVLSQKETLRRCVSLFYLTNRKKERIFYSLDSLGLVERKLIN